MKKIYLLMLFFTAMLVSCGNEISELEPNFRRQYRRSQN